MFNPSKTRARFAVRVAAVLVITVVASPSSRSAASASERCSGPTASGFDQLFQGEVGRVVGADYLRGFELPNGNRLLLMQDTFFDAASNTRAVSSLGQASFAHNAGLLLDASGCVLQTLLGARSYIGSGETQPLTRWFWAMGGGMGADRNLHILVAEMRNPRRTGAATGALPVATWHAIIEPTTLAVTSFAPATDSSASLYGWAVASDDRYTYLYSHCYRQFVPGEPFGHDFECTATINVARVPLGRFDSPLQYWDGTRWQADPSSASPLPFAGDRSINPVSIQHVGDSFVSVSKTGDWWGSSILVDIAPSAVGPWRTVATITPPVKCSVCNTYFASLLPWRQADSSLVVALSNNAWDMRQVVFPNPWIYRPSFIAIALSDIRHADHDPWAWR